VADYTFTQLEALWKQVAPSELQVLAPVMAAIALAESSGDPTNVNPTDNNGTQSSYGLWQISNGTHSPPAPNWADPLENARLALQKYETQGLGAWGTYGGTAYKQYLAANGATDTSGQTVAKPPGTSSASGGDSSSSSGSGPLADVTATVSQAGVLLHDTAKALDWFFHFFQPGQGWRIAFGGAAVVSAYGGIRSWQSASASDDATAALPLAVALFGLAALAGFMTLRQWPTPGGQGHPIQPGAYAVDILEGKPPTAGAAPGSHTTAIEVGLGAILALWGVSKAASGLSGIGAIITGIGGWIARGLKTVGDIPAEDIPVEP
jgi:Lysozyme like domain